MSETTNLRYITPIMDRTEQDVIIAKFNQADLVNKNKGAWNYTDANRVCNNLKYAAQWMYTQGFLAEPYDLSIKLDWKETDVMSYEVLNTMIVSTMNNLKTYSRVDLEWETIHNITNMDYIIANKLEKNIHALATQVPPPPELHKLTIVNGSGSGEYAANTIVNIKANDPSVSTRFDGWSGDYLENVEDPDALETTYMMPPSDATLVANYSDLVQHTLTVVTYTQTIKVQLYMGETYRIAADPAPNEHRFHRWETSPSQFEENLYEPAATTTFAMPNEDVTINAIYKHDITRYLTVNKGTGSGYYDYEEYVSVHSNKPSNATFTTWSGDTQYLTGPATQEYNTIKMPDIKNVTITANWTTPPVTNVQLTVANGVITSTGETTGYFTEGNKISITANAVPDGQVFAGWSFSGGGSISNSGSTVATVTIGQTAATVTATYRTLKYHTLTVTTHSGTTIQTKEQESYFSVNASPYPDGYTFESWSGDTGSYGGYYFDRWSPSAGTRMGTSDRTITANYREIETHTLTVKQLSGNVTYTKAEGEKVTITAESAPAGQRFTGWSLSGQGTISSYSAQTITFTFGNGNSTLTPKYVNQWTITVINGNINYGSTSALLDEGTQYRLQARGMQTYEGFDGWTQVGPGTISNPAATATYFRVGSGDATLTANISKYPDKTLTVLFEEPTTKKTYLVSQTTYTYGSTFILEAPEAPLQTTFLTWLGDVDIFATGSSATASTVTIGNLTRNATVTATYYFPKSPESYTLTVIKGTGTGTYPAGAQIEINANDPEEGWEFTKWTRDTPYLMDQDLTNPMNLVKIPRQAITLEAVYNVIGELPRFEIKVTNGTAQGTYVDSQGVEHPEEGPIIYLPPGTEVTLIADDDILDYTFGRWTGNFEQAGVTDIILDKPITKFTMVDEHINAVMERKVKDVFSAIPVDANAEGVTNADPGKYPIRGILKDTDDKKYQFTHWTCVDANGDDFINAIDHPNLEETFITLTDRSLWIQAHYTTFYKLTVVNGQDDGDGYYYEGQIVTSVRANNPPTENQTFNKWIDPMDIIADGEQEYDPTPTIVMKDSIATITADYISTDGIGNSVVVTGNDLHTGIIRRYNSYLISGAFKVGTLVLDGDGCMGVITEVDPDQSDDTDDYVVEKLFYGGNY